MFGKQERLLSTASVALPTVMEVPLKVQGNWANRFNRHGEPSEAIQPPSFGYVLSMTDDDSGSECRLAIKAAAP